MKVKFSPPRFMGAWAVLLALYLSQASSWSAGEIAAGAISSGLAAALVAHVRCCSEVSFSLRWSWLWLLTRRLPGKALSDCLVVLQTLGPRGTNSQIRAVPFDKHSGKRQEEVAARRALVVAGVSLTPNSVVIDVDPRHERLLIHELVRSRHAPGDGDKLWPL